jgi:EF hand
MKHIILASALALVGSAALAANAAPTEAQIGPAFEKADKNKNGTVELAEAKKFGIAAKFFETANPDKDGSLDKKEFAAAIGLQFAAANPDNDGTLDWPEAKKAGVKTKKVFEQANPDKDGTLDVAEFLAALIAQAK